MGIAVLGWSNSHKPVKMPAEMALIEKTGGQCGVYRSLALQQQLLGAVNTDLQQVLVRGHAHVAVKKAQQLKRI